MLFSLCPGTPWYREKETNKKGLEEKRYKKTSRPKGKGSDPAEEGHGKNYSENETAWKNLKRGLSMQIAAEGSLELMRGTGFGFA